jgi:hypothetical protein
MMRPLSAFVSLVALIATLPACALPLGAQEWGFAGAVTASTLDFHLDPWPTGVGVDAPKSRRDLAAGVVYQQHLWRGVSFAPELWLITKGTTHIRSRYDGHLLHYIEMPLLLRFGGARTRENRLAMVLTAGVAPSLLVRCRWTPSHVDNSQPCSEATTRFGRTYDARTSAWDAGGVLGFGIQQRAGTSVRRLEMGGTFGLHDLGATNPDLTRRNLSGAIVLSVSRRLSPRPGT